MCGDGTLLSGTSLSTIGQVYASWALSWGAEEMEVSVGKERHNRQQTNVDEWRETRKSRDQEI